ncbi:uncharacterized protein ALTATR162_LOCUS8934 [Alternaria atra]|uniref:Uncharacterized protein n=1 Tax=Alternaria atra TaxID=119953 RepID=A0A8J2IH32_9PLEO|nr:uncharacterized protein ALTATR162_LOCUS8934 [Alternaria atra]CAG5178905.1 unnamed protein product [Alternaria atra]
MVTPDATPNVNGVRLAPNSTNTIGNPSTELTTFNPIINNKVSGSNTDSRRGSGDEVPIRNPSIKQRLKNPTEHPWLILAIIALAVLGLGILAMAIVLGLRYAPDHSSATTDRAKPSSDTPTIGSSSVPPESGVNTPTSLPHSPITISTPAESISSLIESMTSMMFTTTQKSTQAPSTQPQPPTTLALQTPNALQTSVTPSRPRPTAVAQQYKVVLDGHALT